MPLGQCKCVSSFLPLARHSGFLSYGSSPEFSFERRATEVGATQCAHKGATAGICVMATKGISVIAAVTPEGCINLARHDPQFLMSDVRNY
jgi:hypothetical protein